MTEEHEQRLLDYLADVRERARQADADLAEALGAARASLADTFADAPLDARFERVIQVYHEHVVRIEKFLHPSPVLDGFPELRALLHSLLQAYWRAMGRDHYDPGSFPMLRMGTEVRMRRGALQSWDVWNARTRHVGWDNSKGVWVVDDPWEPDLDGVPVYWVEREDGSERQLVRQTALRPG